MSFTVQPALTAPKDEAYTSEGPVRFHTPFRKPSMTYGRPSSFVSGTSVLLLIFLIGSGAPVRAQSEERRMVVSVLDQNGTPVEGLGPRDFVVREDGTVREVLRVEPAPNGRQIALLVDTSQAASQATNHFRRGVTTFIEAMYDGNQISIISFGGTPRILVEATTSLAQLRAGVGRIFGFAGHAAHLLDAMLETADGFRRQEAARPTMVVLATEGLDYSNANAYTLLEQLDEIGVSVHTVVLQDRGTAVRDLTGFDNRLSQQAIDRDLVLSQGPRTSGGQRRDLLHSMAAELRMRELAAELRSQYLVVYARPDSLIPPESIEVRAARADLTARGAPLKERSGGY